ncbi:MAG: hypothetical protein J7M05_05005 [Anaerolineae bacterium]|nr:hypothetical protein [Anaerolineae bacterium]
MVKIIAHRGFSERYPENTVLALEKAVELGVDAVEFDVKSTADGVLCLLHDVTVDRTTDGRGVLAEMRWSEVSSLDAGRWKAPHFSGVRIPTLAEVLEVIPSGVEMNIHAWPEGRVTRGIIAQLKEKGKVDQAYIATSAEQIALVRELCPELRVCNMTHQREGDYLELSIRIHSDLVQFFAQDLTPELVQQAHQAGILVNVFYANDVETMYRFLNWGVDAILTDRPDLLLAARDKS